MTLYTRTALNQILEAFGEGAEELKETQRGVLLTMSTHELLEDGLWLADAGRSVDACGTFAEREIFEWHPRQNIDLPALPIPFTEYELAAFFLQGGGWALHQSFLDESACELSDEALEELGVNSPNARNALLSAHALYLLAAGRFDLDDDAGIRDAAEWLLLPAATVVTQAAPAKAEKGQGKVWTDERKAEARAYRKVHGLKLTAKFYGVSEATISKHVPAKKKSTPDGYGVFKHQIK